MLSTSIIIKLLRILECKVERADTEEEKFNLVIFGSYIIIFYVLWIRESEGLMINLTGINKELTRNSNYYLIFLKGKVKGEALE